MPVRRAKLGPTPQSLTYLIVVELGDIFLAYRVYKEGRCKGEEREEGARGYNNGDVALGGVGVQNRLESKP